MTSFDEIRRHIAAHYEIAERGAGSKYITLLVATGREGRRQALTVHEVNGDDGTTYLAISTPVAPLTAVDPLYCLRLNNLMVRGYLSVTDAGREPYLLLCATMPVATLELERLDACLTSLAQTGDNLEAEFTEGGDRF